MKNRPHFKNILKKCKGMKPLKTVVVRPEEETALSGAVEAAKLRLIEPILVGNITKIKNVAKKLRVDISGFETINSDGEKNAANTAVNIVTEGKADSLMKGHIHSDKYLAAVIRKNNGLRTKRRTSHCFVLDIPKWKKPIIITDAALNINPDIKTKIDITLNAINLANAIGIKKPKVAMLSATEKLTIQSAIDAKNVAQKINKMKAKKNAIIDGPLALDNAANKKAAITKGIKSKVAGNADIYVVPNIEAGNIFYKTLTFMAGAECAGIVIAKKPVMLTSRADSTNARIISAALALLCHNSKSMLDS